MQDYVFKRFNQNWSNKFGSLVDIRTSCGDYDQIFKYETCNSLRDKFGICDLNRK